MKSENNLKVQRGFYSFESDPLAGHSGTFHTKIVIPKNSIITRFVIDTTITAVASSLGSVTISWGLQTDDGSAITNGTALALVNVAEAFIAPQAIEGNDFNAVPLKLIHSNEVIMQLVGASMGPVLESLTAGEFYFTIEYAEALV